MKNNKKGFTLAELLIVVAIIAVLVLIAIPVFTKSRNKSEAAKDLANARSQVSEIVTDHMADGDFNDDGDIELTSDDVDAIEGVCEDDHVVVGDDGITVTVGDEELTYTFDDGIVVAD